MFILFILCGSMTSLLVVDGEVWLRPVSGFLFSLVMGFGRSVLFPRSFFNSEVISYETSSYGTISILSEDTGTIFLSEVRRIILTCDSISLTST